MLAPPGHYHEHPCLTVYHGVVSLSTAGGGSSRLNRIGSWCNPGGCDPSPFKDILPSSLLAGWWFQIFFMFTPTWGNDPI